MKAKIMFGLAVLCSMAKAQPCKEIIGYYPNWQWYDRSKLVKPSTIDYEKYSILNYCFFKPETSGLISNTDAWADENLLQGQINWSTTPPSYYPNTSIIDLAHNANVKVMVSIGGWTLSDNFPSIAADPTKRALFASECNRLLSFYNFDGIDIDWEYPGFVEHNGTPADKANFTLFLQQIRDSITDLGTRTGKTYLLSACFGASTAHAANIEWANVSSILDMLNIMSYDFFGTWDHAANHNSPLYAPLAGDPTFNLNYFFNYLTTTYGVSPNKINMGVAFYGRSQTGASTLYGSTSGLANTSLFYEDDGTPLYYNVKKNLSLFSYHWDNDAKVPYLLGNPSGIASGTFVSFDDEQSIGLKAAFIRDNNARGAIIWEITGDYLETTPGSGVIAGTPLVDTLNSVFCSSGTVLLSAGVVITSNDADNSICAGNSITFTAVPTNGGSSPTYQWKVNGANVGTSSPTYTSSTLNNGDVVTCVMTSSLGSVVGSPATSNSINIIVNAVPSMPVITLDGTGTQLISSASSGNQWYLDGVLIPGATGQTIAPTSTGTYTVIVTTSGCSSPASAAFNYTSVGVRELNNSFDLTLYPNPNEGVFNIAFSTTKEQTFNVSLLNAMGQVVYTASINGNGGKITKVINLKDAHAGVYTLTVQSKDNNVIRKIIVR